MDFLYNEDPIIACSSGNIANCAIAVIRLSGFKDAKVFQPFLSLDINKLEPRKAHFCKLLDGDNVIDEVVAVFFKAPKSYNGENILELSVHGNVLNVDRIINLFTSSKEFRLAQPGEFSYRALKNKKLNLSQVEGLDLLLNASSEFALDQGFSLMSGRLQESYINLHKSFLNHRSSVEFSIDFLEDMGEEAANRQFRQSLLEFKDHLEKLHSRVNVDSTKLLNPEIALMGQPNSGKSTLFNMLMREERSIVTSIAGTTRDYISESIKIGDVHYRLVDTAGLRQSQDLIEMEGVKRSLALGEKAFFRILLINPLEFDFEYLSYIQHLPFDLILYTHSDKMGFGKALQALRENPKFEKFLADPMGAEKAGPMGAEKTGPMGAEQTGPMGAEKAGPMGAEQTGPMGAEKAGPMGANFTRLSNFEYLTNLSNNNPAIMEEINCHLNNKYLYTISSQPILLQRHKQKIFEAHELLLDYVSLTENETDISIISSELNNIGHCISELVGIISPDDVLHNIFDNFCIGK